MAEIQHWIGVVSRSHVAIGVRGGFIQLNHGKKAAVQRLKAGDRIVLYSPKTDYPNGEPLQAFTALGIVRASEIYQVEMAEDFKPYRIDVDFLDVTEAPIRPMLSRLSFIKDPMRWGAAFRFGQLKVPAGDFAIIAAAMNCTLPTY